MNVFEYLIRADTSRKTRWHDSKSNFVGLAGLLYTPIALGSTGMRYLLGYRPVCPWFPQPAIKALERLMQRDWRILEFGSGMSTIWLASRCDFLHSIEHDATWFANVSALLEQRGLTSRVRYELRDLTSYCDLSEYTNPSIFFDLCIVDGAQRAKCIAQAVSRIKPGGYIYWDNSDNVDDDAREAERHLLEGIKERHGECQYFLGFPPTTFHVTRGMLARL